MTLPEPYYKDDYVTIYNADYRYILLDLPKVDLILTYPPYEINGMGGGGFGGHQFYQNATGICDMISFDNYDPIFAEKTDEIVIFHSRLQIHKWSEYCLKHFGNYDLHVWYKPNAIPFTHNTWKSDIEYIALGWREKNHVKVSQELKSKVFVHPIESENLHPAQKPIELMLKYILILNPVTVLDPFMGSGTTLRAAKNLGVKSIGIDISEKYCEIAAKRCMQEAMNFNIEVKEEVKQVALFG